MSLRDITRRHFFEQASFGIGGLALASLIGTRVSARDQAAALQAQALQFAPKAKRVIYLFMAGAPSQIDLFDPKPVLSKHDGEDIPAEFIKGERFAFIKGTPKLLGPRSSSGSTASRVPRSRSCSRTSRRSPTTSPLSGRCRRRSSIMRRRRFS